MGIADAHGRTPAQIALRWEIQHGVVVIPKSVTEERILANAQVFDFALTAEEMATMDALDRGADGRMGPDPTTFS